MNFPLPAVAAALGALTAGCPSLPVTGWSVDSRSVQPGDVFFAIRGPHHDGHQFVADVFRRGAVAAVVDRPVEAAGTLPVPALYAAMDKVIALSRRPDRCFRRRTRSKRSRPWPPGPASGGEEGW